MRHLQRIVHHFIRKTKAPASQSQNPPLEKQETQEDVHDGTSRFRGIERVKQLLKEAELNDKTEDTSFDKYMRQSQKMKKKMIKQQMQEKKNRPNPPPLKEQLRQLHVPQEVISSTPIKEKQFNPFYSQEQIKAFNEAKDRQILMAKQELLLAEIEQNSKEKQVPLNLPKRATSKDDELVPSDEQINLLIRKQKLYEAIQNKINPKDAMLTVTKQELISKKYSEEIIELAKTHKTQELKYFKELVMEDTNEDKRYTDRRFSNQTNQKQKQPPKQLVQKKLVDVPQVYGKEVQEQGVQLFEDIQFYKNKALRQFSQSQNRQQINKQLTKASEEDLKRGNKASNIFIDDKLYPEETAEERAQIYKQSSFGKMQQKVLDASKLFNKHGIDHQIEDFYKMQKQALFEQKKLRQVQQQFQKHLARKEKKKAMKEQLKQMHDRRLREDVDFDKEEVPVTTLKKMKKGINPVEFEEELATSKAFHEQKESVLVPENQDQARSLIHYEKTYRNMVSFLQRYFVNKMYNMSSDLNEKIELIEVLANKKNTVLTVFWKLLPQYLLSIGLKQGIIGYQQLLKKEQKQIQQRLKNQSTYISGKMTQMFGLRYGPDIRFQLEEETKESKDMKKELNKYKKEISMLEVQKYRQKYTTPEQEHEAYQKMLKIAENNLDQFSQRKKMLSKKYRLQKKREQWEQKQMQKTEATETRKIINEFGTKDKKTVKNNPSSTIYNMKDEKIEENAVLQMSPSRKKKKNAVQALWKTIDLL